MRRGGVLLHPTSLPGPGPIGELGPYAHAFLDWMSQSGLSVWQVLPLHPVGPGHSPYDSPSAFAGDWRLISIERLVTDGLLSPVAMPWGTDLVDVDTLIAWKRPLIEAAARQIAASSDCQMWAETQPWLPDWSLYAALRSQTGMGWQSFGGALPNATLRRENAEAIRVEVGVQYLFARHWQAVREDAAARGITILGDVPLFVADDGADVWANRTLFAFDNDVADPIAGVPPDYFSPEGQRWGNPTYAWDAHARDGFAWWVRRLQRAFDLVDQLRLDHFRGLVANWAIAADEPDARKGAWRPGPGMALFDALEAKLPGVTQKLVAEDLGEITPDVHALREALGLPGMKILQFAFGTDGSHPFLPHNIVRNSVVYTGTHDNDTTLGWYRSAGDDVQHRFRVYTGRDGVDVLWGMLREAWASVAQTAVAPMQDVLGLDSSARMNVPGSAAGNWCWRLRELPWHRCSVMRSLAETYDRTGF